MKTLFSVLHVVSSVFIVGPMAILPMTAMRAVRARNASQVEVLAKSTNLMSLLSLLVILFGFGVLGLADKKYNFSVTSPWILWSLILYAVALGLALFLVVPAMRRAAAAIRQDAASVVAANAVAPTGAAPDGAVLDAVAPTGTAPTGYGAIAAGSGMVSLLLVAVVVLMVWKP